MKQLFPDFLPKLSEAAASDPESICWDPSATIKQFLQQMCNAESPATSISFSAGRKTTQQNRRGLIPQKSTFQLRPKPVVSKSSISYPDVKFKQQQKGCSTQIMRAKYASSREREF